MPVQQNATPQKHVYIYYLLCIYIIIDIIDYILNYIYQILNQMYDILHIHGLLINSFPMTKSDYNFFWGTQLRSSQPCCQFVHQPPWRNQPKRLINA